MTESEQRAFWKKLNLQPYDWSGLTNQVFARAFSPEFLVPLEDDEETFRIEVQAPDLEFYIETIEEGTSMDDLDRIRIPMSVSPAIQVRQREPIISPTVLQHDFERMHDLIEKWKKGE